MRQRLIRTIVMTIIVIPDASHALIPEQPDAVVNAVRGWTRTLPGN